MFAYKTPYREKLVSCYGGYERHFRLTGGIVFFRYMDLEDKMSTNVSMVVCECRNRPLHCDQLNPGVSPQHAVSVHQQMGDTFGHLCQPDHILSITSSDE